MTAVAATECGGVVVVGVLQKKDSSSDCRWSVESAGRSLVVAKYLASRLLCVPACFFACCYGTLMTSPRTGHSRDHSKSFPYSFFFF